LSSTDTAVPVREGLFTDAGLIGGRCPACGGLQFPASTVCPDCQGTDVREVELSTEGVVYTFTIVRATPPDYRGPTPYAYGVVELPEGLRLTTTITADDLDAITIGGPATFETLVLGTGGEDAITAFAYRIASGGTAA
jgi:uncharacterized OB-fold protein